MISAIQVVLGFVVPFLSACCPPCEYLESFLNILLFCLIDGVVNGVEILYVQTYRSKRPLSAAFINVLGAVNALTSNFKMCYLPITVTNFRQFCLQAIFALSTASARSVSIIGVVQRYGTASVCQYDNVSPPN